MKTYSSAYIHLIHSFVYLLWVHLKSRLATCVIKLVPRGIRYLLRDHVVHNRRLDESNAGSEKGHVHDDGRGLASNKVGDGGNSRFLLSVRASHCMLK